MISCGLTNVSVLCSSSFSVSSSHCINQILESVSHIHQHDIVHRDLKVSDHTPLVNIEVPCILYKSLEKWLALCCKWRLKTCGNSQHVWALLHTHTDVTQWRLDQLKGWASSFCSPAFFCIPNPLPTPLLPFIRLPPSSLLLSALLPLSLLHCWGVTKANQLLLIAGRWVRWRPVTISLAASLCTPGRNQNHSAAVRFQISLILTLIQ